MYIDIEPNSDQKTDAMAGDSTNIFFDERHSDPQGLIQKGLLLNIRLPASSRLTTSISPVQL